MDRDTEHLNCSDCNKRKNGAYYKETCAAFREWEVAKKAFGLGSTEEISAWNKAIGRKVRTYKSGSTASSTRPLFS